MIYRPFLAGKLQRQNKECLHLPSPPVVPGAIF